MKNFIDLVPDPHDEVSQKVINLRQRFRSNRRTITTSVHQYSRQENNVIQQHKRRSVYQDNSPSIDLQGRSHFTRSRVALDVRSYGWKFVRADQTLCDVDPQKYLYELIRGKHLSDSAIQAEKEHYLQQSLVLQQNKFSVTTKSLDSFDYNYVQSVAKSLNRTKIKGPMVVKAFFGQTRFQINSLDTNREFRLSELPNLKSSWSNVCNDKDPTIRALVGELNGGGASEITTLRLAVRCCLTTQNGPRYAKISFLRKEGKWVYERACALISKYGCHDIFLRNHTCFRVKIFSHVSTPGKTWWSTIHKSFCFHEASNGDPFATKVTLEACPRENVRIDNVSIKETSGTVKFRGLYFQLSKKQDSISLQAAPPRNKLQKKRAGDCFEFLVTRLVQILDNA
ncbi:hypothetical protein F442_00947 [Phytophthora nicotianae P10297]|uniref:Uncharacterized protein n=2 Tax=Phytophthora nicotianae TaxID=4792 RepID=V9FZG4_PHYNI|nr:hypothetical protein F443_00995 [Phytophthora nicotianae P1569]ETP54279.1 hypothetical protein F442_00947 [Phytophthora nicotianae P10297]